ncbi:MAG: sortase B protein-sorting domain-containing protein, partial [Christensenellaceae bacterium]|nr:sortase B protein-sorting domain-containing protein [Christensenellaceae bacterium]
NPASYSNTDTFPIAIGDPTRNGYTFEGWTVDYADAGITDLTTPTASYTIPSGTTGNITLTANWKKNPGVIGGGDGMIGGEADTTPSPSATPEPSPSATPWPGSGGNEVPKTGDEANLALWAALLGLAAVLPGTLAWGIKRIRG